MTDDTLDPYSIPSFSGPTGGISNSTRTPQPRPGSTPTPEREIVFWDCAPDSERLSYDDIGEAVNAWADDIYPDPLPETVTVFGFARMPLPSAQRLAEDALHRIIESLDEEHGSPDEDTEYTDAMEAAALAFAQAILAEYKSWNCECVTERIERVADHVPSEWLTRPAHAEPTDD